MSKQGSLEVLLWKIGVAGSATLADIYEGANRGEYQGTFHSFFRSDIIVELHNWLPEMFLIIYIKIEYSSAGTVNSLIRE